MIFDYSLNLQLYLLGTTRRLQGSVGSNDLSSQQLSAAYELTKSINYCHKCGGNDMPLKII